MVGACPTAFHFQQNKTDNRLMRFDSDLQPAPYLNRKDQRRLLAMVGVLCLAVMAVSWAARPESWYWLVPPDNDTAQNVPAETELPEPSDQSKRFVDLSSSDNASSDENESALENLSRKQLQSTTENPASADLPASWLESINDQAIGLRAEEADAYYRVLGHIFRLDDRYLDKHARKDILYVNLLRNPDQYRGKLMTIRGIARRISPIQVGENQYGIKQTHEAWVLTPDSGSDPWRFVASGIDPRLPVGEKVAVQIEVTGYFLKLYGYASQKGQHLAPLILAARIKPCVVRKTVPSSTGLEPYIMLFAVIVGFGAIITVIVYSRGDRKFKQKMKTDFPDKQDPPENFFEQMQSNDANESLFS